MHNILLAGVGGQGSVLAAKILAQAAESKGWHVRTAETIGMAQRGGNVVSHIRMGNNGEDVYSPLISRGTADVIIAFEPGEAARNLSYLSPYGTLVTAKTILQPTTSALSKTPYTSRLVLQALEQAMTEGQTLKVIDDAAILREIGDQKVLNTVLLSCAIGLGALNVPLDDLKSAVEISVKPGFIEINQRAIEFAQDFIQSIE